MQPASHSKLGGEAFGINYDKDDANLLNNLRFGSYEDSLEFKVN
jgi:hypothetical protein